MILLIDTGVLLEILKTEIVLEEDSAMVWLRIALFFLLFFVAEDVLFFGGG